MQDIYLRNVFVARLHTWEFSAMSKPLDLKQAWLRVGRQVHVYFDEDDEWHSDAVIHSIEADRVLFFLKSDKKMLFYLEAEEAMAKLIPVLTVAPIDYTERHHLEDIHQEEMDLLATRKLENGDEISKGEVVELVDGTCMQVFL